MKTATITDAWTVADPIGCPVCGLEACEDHIPDQPEMPAGRATQLRAVPALDPEGLADGTEVVAEGQQIALEGVRYKVDGIVPDYGMLGMEVAYAKVGKTSLGQALAAAVATGQPFLSRETKQARVLIVAAEDPPEYTAWLARNLVVPAGTLTFYRRSLLLDASGLAALVGTIRSGGYGLVLISSWQAVIRGLVRDENDNAGAVRVVESVKAAARTTGIPWLIDAHSGKGEDQSDDADPSKAMRGASSAAGAADYTLSLRYDSSPFATRRRLSGKGRFVNFDPILLDCDLTTSTYTVIGSTKAASTETTWRLITETGALTTAPQTTAAIAMAAGLSVGKNGKATAASRHQVMQALMNREGVRLTTETIRGQKTSLYSLVTEP
jgi:hypothetical protein